jgi:hypothetical protein
MGSASSFFANPFKDPLGALFDPAGHLGLKKEDKVASPAVPPSAEPTSDVPSMDDGTEAAQRQRRRQATASGRSSTVLTSPLGLTEPASTSRRQLLGR